MEPGTIDLTEKSPVLEIDLIGMLRRRWLLILAGVFAGIFLAALYYVTAERKYEAHVEILVGQRSSEATNNGTINGANASGDKIHEDQLATHMRLFVSRRRLAAAIKKGNLGFLDSFKEAAQSGKSGIDHILDHIEVLRGGDDSSRDAMVIRATYQDSSPEDAALVLNAIYESYRDYAESHGQNSTEQAVELMEEARQLHEKELEIADQEYREFVKSVPVLIDGEGVKDVHKDRLANLEKELNTVSTSLAESRSRLEVIQTYMGGRSEADTANAGNVSRANPNIDHLALLSQKEVARLKLFLDMTRGEVQSEAFQADQPMRQEAAKAHYNRLLDLIQRERTLAETFGPSHPLVSTVKTEIEITQRFIEQNSPEQSSVASKKLDPAEMLATYTSLLANDISEMEKRHEILVAESQKEMKLAKEVENAYLKGSALRSKLQRAQARYDQVILRLQELRLSRSYAGFSTDLLASPEVPNKAAWPKLPIVGAVGLFLGMLLGLGLAIGSELMDSTFGSVRDLEQAVGAPAIAHVPRFDPRTLAKQMQRDSLVQPSLVSFHAPRSAESEIYRVARTALMITNRKESVQTMMMTSPQPGDGKSTTISNLAISFARAGKQVLLIDADMRRPVISGLFAVEGEPGLSDVLTGSISTKESIQDSSVPNLSLIANGSSTPAPAELLESPRFAMLLAELSHQYDLILIDAPPLLAVADPSIIAPLVDAVVLTVRVTKNGRRPVEQASKILHHIGISPVGVVVNGVDQDAKTYGYGSYSRDGYGYVGHYHDSYSASPEQSIPEQPIDDQLDTEQPIDDPQAPRPIPVPSGLTASSFRPADINRSIPS